MQLVRASRVYVLVSDQERFQSQVGDDERGDWLSTQLEKFRIAVLSWQARTDSPPLFPKRQNAGPFTDWHARFQLPQIQLCLSPVVPRDGLMLVSGLPLFLFSFLASGMFLYCKGGVGPPLGVHLPNATSRNMKGVCQSMHCKSRTHALL